jgi:hypothetical protein
VSPRDEAGQHQPAAEVDLFALTVETWRDRGDAAGFDAMSTGAAEDCVRARRKIRSKAACVLIGDAELETIAEH